LRPDVWLFIEVEDSILHDKPLGDGVKVRYMVTPTLKILEENRDVDVVVNSAVDAGFEVTFASSTSPGLAPWQMRKVEAAVLEELRTRLGKNVRSFAVSITPLNRMIKYSK
jgi:hypothetical protein